MSTKKAIVISVTSGIGRKLTGMLAKSGFKVWVTGRRSKLLSELSSEKPAV